jgi:SHS2 domain-containing protein
MSAYALPDAPPPFEVIEHTADWSIRVWAPDLPALFARAAQGMAYLLVGDLAAVPQTVTAEISLEGYDAVDLLVAWLSELAYFTEQDGTVFTTIDDLRLIPPSLSATVRGGPPAEILKHIKAVTYHDLRITEMADGLETTIVFDV